MIPDYLVWLMVNGSYIYLTIFLLVILRTVISFARSKFPPGRYWPWNDIGETVVFGEHLDPTAIVILIHGTWARGGKWHVEGSEFINKLKACLTDSARNNNTFLRPQFRRCLWGGGNTLFDRLAGAARLRTLIHEIRTGSCSDVPIFIIAHSHGGNVAVKALCDDDELCKAVTGVCCVSTPFLLHYNDKFGASRDANKARRRQKIDRNAKVLGLMMPLIFALGIVSLRHSVPMFAFVSLMIVLCGIFYFYARWCNENIIRTTLHDREVSEALFEKVLPIRSAGDEASAALGAAYIAKFALTLPVRIVNVWLDVNYYFWADTEREMKEVAAKCLLISKKLSVVAGIYFAVFCVISWPIDDVRTIGWAALPLGVVIAFAIFSKTLLSVFGVAITVISFFVTTLRFCITAIIYSLTGILLFPFAPELIFSTSVIGLTAEASLPHRKSAIGNIAQLAGDRRTLNHSAYDHKAIAGVIVNWMNYTASKSASKILSRVSANE